MSQPPADDQGQIARQNAQLQSLIHAGIEIGGGSLSPVAATVIGGLIAGPAGIAIGGVAGTLIQMACRKVGSELASRQLGPRGQARVGYVFTLAAAEIGQRIGNGEQPRTDGFFDESSTDRSQADEVWEHILLKSQTEAEEKKLPYMSHLFAKIAFDARISPQIAHQIAKVGELLTFRQLCILSLVASIDGFKLRECNYSDERQFSEDLYYTLCECKDLEDRGLIFVGTFMGEGHIDYGTEGYVPGGQNIIRRRRSGGNPTARKPDIPEMVPATMQLQPFGMELYDLMGLREIPREELKEIAELLR